MTPALMTTRRMAGKGRYREVSKEPELIALAAVYQDGATVRSKIPAPVVKALRVKGGDVLAFEQQGDGAVVVRKSTATNRKSLIKSPASKKGTKK